MPGNFSGLGQNELKELIDATELRALELKNAFNKTAPIHVLPLDVMVEIFALLVYSPDDSRTSSKPGEHEGKLVKPLLIGRICSMWRNIAWSTPRLWKNIHIRSFGCGDILKVRLEILGGWIERSGNQPLYIRLSSDSEGSEAAYDLLLTSCSRWRILDVFEEASLFSKMLSYRECFFPLLAFVNIRGRGGPDWMYSSFPSNTWVFNKDNTPQLQKFYIFTSKLSYFEVDWSTLKDISVHFDLPDTLKMLQSAAFGSVNGPALKKAVLDVQVTSHSSRTDYTYPAEPISFPHLKSLEISIGYSGVGPEEVDALLGSIDSTCLNSFGLKFTRKSDPSFKSYTNVSTNLGRILGHSGHCLRYLELKAHRSDSPFTESQILDLLHLVPELLKFKLEYGCPCSDRIIKALDPSLWTTPSSRLPEGQDGTFNASTCTRLLPNLISFRYIGPVSCNPDAVKSMLKSRVEQADDFDVAPLLMCNIQYTSSSQMAEGNWGMPNYEGLGTIVWISRA